MASVSAVPSRNAVAYLTISSYCSRMSSQLIGRVSIGCRFGCAGGGCLTPNMSEPCLEDGVGHLGDGISERVAMQEAPLDVQQVLVTLAVLATAHPLESGVGAQRVQA